MSGVGYDYGEAKIKQFLSVICHIQLIKERFLSLPPPLPQFDTFMLKLLPEYVFIPCFYKFWVIESRIMERIIVQHW